MLMIFFVGIVEMIIATTWTHFVSKNMILSSGSITFINILIWYYVLEKIINNLDNVWIVLFYALGCAIGTMISIYYLDCKEKKSKTIKQELSLRNLSKQNLRPSNLIK